LATASGYLEQYASGLAFLCSSQRCDGSGCYRQSLFAEISLTAVSTCKAFAFESCKPVRIRLPSSRPNAATLTSSYTRRSAITASQARGRTSTIPDVKATVCVTIVASMSLAEIVRKHAHNIIIPDESYLGVVSFVSISLSHKQRDVHLVKFSSERINADVER
jgi:hypothetical protein